MAAAPPSPYAADAPCAKDSPPAAAEDCEPAPGGITNLGNTCYIGSVLQLILHAPLLRYFFFTGPLPGSAASSPEALASPDWALLQSLDDVFQQAWSPAGENKVNLSRFIFAVWNAQPQFRGKDQQDAHEFLLSLLDVLDCIKIHPHKRDLCTFQRREQASEPRGGSGQRAPCHSDLVGLSTYVFGGETQNSLACCNCSATSSSTSALKMLAVEPRPDPAAKGPAGKGKQRRKGGMDCVSSGGAGADDGEDDGTCTPRNAGTPAPSPSPPVMSPQPASQAKNSQQARSKVESEALGLGELLGELNRQETVSDWRCEQCNEYGGVKSCSVSRLPRVALVHVNRRNLGLRKIRTSVLFGVCDQDLNACCDAIDTPEQPVLYDLVGLVEHRGRTSAAGHYVCYVRRGNVWFLCNDAKVIEVDEADVCKAEAYLLMYKQQGLQY